MGLKLSCIHPRGNPMLRISKLTDYATVILALLARDTALRRTAAAAPERQAEQRTEQGCGQQGRDGAAGCASRADGVRHRLHFPQDAEST